MVLNVDLSIHPLSYSYLCILSVGKAKVQARLQTRLGLRWSPLRHVSKSHELALQYFVKLLSEKSKDIVKDVFVGVLFYKLLFLDSLKYTVGASTHSNCLNDAILIVSNISLC